MEKYLYKSLCYEDFFDQFDEYLIENTINGDINWVNSRCYIYNWFKQYIRKQSKSNLEKILTFITGSSRVPLINKITVSLIY